MIKSFFADRITLPENYRSLECSETLRSIWERDTMDEFESFYIIYLNSKNEMIGYDQLCTGNYINTCFDLRRAVKDALNYKSPAFILAHNHTFGVATPSPYDIDITNDMLVTLDTLNIKLIDHIILTTDSYFSFQDSGLLNLKKRAG